ncbi:MAG: imidazole glycerol phosphate synthase subunit HisH [Escherichia coli]|nr:MAG: imidazole glycerol phosphate synthase subunit HisH [Escherichia coli]
MVAIIDYGAGNLQSVKKALDYIGAESVITSDAKIIESSSHVILPGVGSFEDAVNSINSSGLREVIIKSAKEKHFLGICLGLQLLFERSEESPNAEGLGILKGEVVKIPSDKGLKVPHIGWNSIDVLNDEGIFKDIPQSSYFYFVHSYYIKCYDKDVVSAMTHYGVPIECAVKKGNLSAVQFHPEKSGEVGLQLLKNFVFEGDICVR